MSDHKVKQQSPSKQIRCKAREYLRFTFYRPGRVYYKRSIPQQEMVNSMRMTETMVKPKQKQHNYSRSPSKEGKQSIKRRKSKHSVNKDHMSHMQKSPYLSLSNASQVQKMLKFLIPVSGPNESVRQQIKRHNYLNFMNAQLLIVKKSQKFQERMKAYSKRMGLPQNSKIYTMNSKDKHIKEALNRRGWIESSQQQSVLFHLKWVYKDNINDYVLLQQGQLYNHFKNNQELTNKNSLRKNIKNAPIQQRPNFPLSYDIDSNDDNSSFNHAFMKLEAYKLLGKVNSFIQNKYHSLYSKIISNPLYFLNHNKQQMKKNDKTLLKSILYATSIEQLQRLKLWTKLQGLFQYFAYIAETIQEDRHIPYSIFHRNKESKYSLKEFRLTQGQFSYGADQIFSHLSPFYFVQIIKMWRHSQNLLQSYGHQNMWIIKPTGVSRGSGITITNDLSKIAQLRYGKMVQKYIQNPLLLDCGRKFDLRQWVLVTSFQPLNVYIFKSCYARFSSQRYSNDKYQNLQKHLTNYSQNKQSYLKQRFLIKDNLFKNNIDLSSAMSEEELSIKIGPKWRKIKQQFYLDIIKTLKCCKKQIIQKQSCFQLYGFDIILDQNCKPYILQVNMSPACEQRQFLRNYLQQMADGIVSMIEGQQPIGWIKFTQEKLQKLRLKNLITQKALIIQRWWRRHKKLKTQQ